jgi:hypothetical protein
MRMLYIFLPPDDHSFGTAPKLLGLRNRQEIPLFAGSANKTKLKLLATKQFFNGAIALSYVVAENNNESLTSIGKRVIGVA